MNVSRTLATLTAAAVMALTGCGLPAGDAQQALTRAPAAASWRYPAPRLDQGDRPGCGFYAALQQLNAPGARITQAQADRMWREFAPQAPSATRTSDDILKTVLAKHGVRAIYRTIPTSQALTEVYRGPLVVSVRYLAGMDDTARDGHWLARGALAGYDHAVVLTGYDPKARRVLLLNQWGRAWGRDGGMWLTAAEWQRLAASATVWTLG